MISFLHILKICDFLNLKLECIYLPPGNEENEDTTVSSAEPGSGSDSGSGEILTEEDQHIRKILDLQRSIPYKERKNIAI